MKVVVTGIGLLCSLGNLDQSWQKLQAGKSALKLYQPFPELSPRSLGIIHSSPAELDNLTQSLLATALEDAKLSVPLPECGVVIGSSRACQSSWEELATHRQNSPLLTNWLDTFPHQGAVLTARLIGSTAPVIAPMAACATGIWAIHQGVELIETGICQRVIVGAIEAPVTRLTLAGFERMGALAKTGAYPFDRQREGFALGEGGAFLVLESAALALERGVPVYGQILGCGFSCDAHHATAPELDGRSAIAAVKQCLERSQLEPAQVDYIHAHGTGTKRGDRREAKLIETLFPQRTAVSSTKGATGHTLGASGALGIAFSLMALKHQQLPPCVGLREPEFELNFVTTSHPCVLKQLLCFSFGFGGQNAAIALKEYQ